MKKIWNHYFNFKTALNRKGFWKGFFWSILITIPLAVIISVSAQAGAISIIVILPAVIFIEWMFASLVIGRFKCLGVSKKWIFLVMLMDLIPFVRIGYLVAFGLVNFPHPHPEPSSNKANQAGTT